MESVISRRRQASTLTELAASSSVTQVAEMLAAPTQLRRARPGHQIATDRVHRERLERHNLRGHRSQASSPFTSFQVREPDGWHLQISNQTHEAARPELNVPPRQPGFRRRVE